jgi:hypothetical protein
MSPQDITQIVTAACALTAAIIGYLNRQNIGKVHKQVNSNAKDQVARVDQLSSALQQANITVPPRPENDPTVDEQQPPAVGAGT